MKHDKWLPKVALISPLDWEIVYCYAGMKKSTLCLNDEIVIAVEISDHFINKAMETS